MSTTTYSAVSALGTAMIAALHNAGVGAFWDDGGLLIVHAADVEQGDALKREHVMVDWTARDDATTFDGALLEATAWEPDGLPDYAQIATVYATPPGCPIGEEADRCARAVAEWFAEPRPTTGEMMLAAFAEYGITPGNGLHETYGMHGDVFEIPLPLPGDGCARLAIADREGSLRHVPAAHTGWSIFLHDEHGYPIGDPVYITGDGGSVDCAEDSANAAAFIADFLTAPVSRHCDCYSQERYGRRHDHECNRYRRPVIAPALTS